MEIETDDNRITFRINSSALEELRELCREIDLKPSEVVRFVINRYLEEVRSSPKAKAKAVRMAKEIRMIR
jgi:antitoxin component of RelBE/YafQ-DinJ toxin-antitoxin module